MRVLLDTHALLWWLLDDPRLSEPASRLLSHPDTTVVVSAVSGWEIATKHRLVKLPVPDELATDLGGVALSRGWELLMLTMQHAQSAGNLPGRHKDPFDRMLAAQAVIEGMPLVTNDPAIAGFGCMVVW